MHRKPLSLRQILPPLSFLLFTSFAALNVRAGDFELLDSDRVVFLGDGLIEQEQYAAWVEVMMTTAFPDRDITFRNLGWSGDTPAGKSRFGLSLLRAGLEPDDEGWKQLQKQLELTKPTVLVVGYGMSSLLESGTGGIDAFVHDYEQLMEAAQHVSPGVRFVLLTPIGRLDATNEELRITERYENAILQLANKHQSPSVSLSKVGLANGQRKDRIHLNSNGYKAMAVAIGDALEFPDSGWENSPHSEALRQTILRKNQWWFNRSRPSNMAYVFGFRKHEQGQNAIEIPQFDDLIAKEEAKIAALRALKPVSLQEPKPQLKSKYAEFTEQPVPEFTVADGWEITLWAQNPQLNKPIHMNFDPQGRLWIASSEAYPMIEVGQAAPDKILVLEDTTGDGKSDKSTVFADGLLIPTGIAPGNGGVYVAQSTDLLFLKDTDGDGRADIKRRVLSGFGTEDTHHNLHTLRWGPDGRLYMNQSVYTRTDAETPQGVVRLKAGGGFRYDIRGMRMEIFFRGLWNSWGHQFDAFGQSFLSDGAGFDGFAYTFPGATFNPTPGARQQMELISPGRYPKFASIEIVYGDTFPADWQGSMITCDFRANRVTRFGLSEQGAGFITKQEDDLVRTSAATFRPIDVKQGPDGALYIADWSNPIINHGEVDFRDPRRDRWHGRIWRLAWKGAEPQRTVDLTAMNTPVLLDMLKTHDRNTRDQARRVLIERRVETLSYLPQWVDQQDTESAKLQGLWLSQALDVPAHELLSEMLTAKESKIRAAAVRVLSTWADPDAQPRLFVQPGKALELFGQLVTDEHPRVRLEAVRGVALLGSAEAADVALQVLRKPMDRFLEHALALTVNELAAPLMQEIESGNRSVDSPAREQQLEFVLTSIEPSRASRYLTQRLAAKPIAKNGTGPWIELIGKAGGAAELGQLLDQVVSDGFDRAATVQALSALSSAKRLRKLAPVEGLLRIGPLLSSSHSDIQLAAIELAGKWKLTGLSDRLVALVSNKSTPDPVRRATIAALRDIGQGESLTSALANLARNDPSREIRSQAVLALASVNVRLASAPFFSTLSRTESEQEALGLWRGMLNTKGAGKILAAKIAEQSLPEFALTAGWRAVRDGGRNEPELLAAFPPLNESSAIELTPQRISQIVEQVAEGDPAKGEMIYRRTELACATCHAIAGVGGKVGPDMTSLGASAPVDYLIESLFDPNAKIKEGFHSVIVATEDDQILTGVEISSNDQELVLRDAADKIVRIPQADIIGKKAGKSLMPVGAVDRLTQQEQVDLICFLSKLGKPGAYDASQGGVARVFEIFAGTHRIEQGGADRIISGEIAEGWMPLQSFVNGGVPKSILEEMTEQPFMIALVHVYARTQFEIAESGTTTFTVPINAAIWIDGTRIDGNESFTTLLDAGKHTVLVRLDARDLPDVFRLESRDVVFATEQE